MPYKDPEKRKEADRKYREKHREQMNAYAREWRKANPEKRREIDKRYLNKHSDKAQNACKNWRQQNPEKYKASYTNWRRENKERIKITAKQYRLLNKDKLQQYHYQWRKEHPEAWALMRAKSRIKHIDAIKAKRLIWVQNNRETIRNANRNRRALKAGAAGKVSTQQLLDRINFFGGLCAYCGAVYEHVDHVIPLSRGGTNWPANLRPACKTCNLKKHANNWKNRKIYL